MQNKHTTSTHSSNDSVLRDCCLSWGFPSVVILAISLLVALRVGASFEQSTFAACISFVVCAMFLSLIYYTIFQSLPLSIYNMWEGKHTTEVEAEAESEITSEQIVEAEEPKPSEAIEVQEAVEQLIEEPSDGQTEEPTPQIPSSPIFNQEYYESRRQSFLQQQEEERLAKISCIIDYTRHVMSALMKMEEIEHLCVEVRNWADNATYKPETVHMLSDAIKLDAKHYVWNIAERLGGEHSKINNRSPFIKALFNDMFHDNDLTSLKNLTVKPNEGTIKIDNPDKGSYLFAYQKPVEEE